LITEVLRSDVVVVVVAVEEIEAEESNEALRTKAPLASVRANVLLPNEPLGRSKLLLPLLLLLLVMLEWSEGKLREGFKEERPANGGSGVEVAIAVVVIVVAVEDSALTTIIGA
jgi:hypothetical protein